VSGNPDIQPTWPLLLKIEKGGCNFNYFSSETTGPIRYFLVISIPAESPVFSKCDWNDDMIASNCTKKTTEMLYLLPTLPSIRFTLRNTAPVLIKLNGPFHFYRE
jgi:hypothetical protein